jgi:ribosomal-protein-alanine N-acetyltransferase
MTIRPLTPFDASAMAGMEKVCFSLPWSLESVKGELNNPIARYFGAFINGELSAYAGIQIVLDEGHITNIAVAPQHRRKGIADRLLAELLLLAIERGLAFVTLEVREGNVHARSLYKKHGFVVVGLRKGYYDLPTEDAVLMTKEF